VAALGIDISKADFHCCLLAGTKRSQERFPNTRAGFRKAIKWVKGQGYDQVAICMEATGSYWRGLATALHDAHMTVSVVNPSRTAFFARSQLRRTKTDQVDCEMIGEFCKTQSPEKWTPPPPEVLELRALLTYREHLVNSRMRLKAVDTQVDFDRSLKRFHAKHVAALDAGILEIEKRITLLIRSHPNLRRQTWALRRVDGLGVLTAAIIVSQLPIDQLRNGKAAAAYAGLSPCERQSGVSVNGKPRICKTGNSALRKALYMPALVALQRNVALIKELVREVSTRPDDRGAEAVGRVVASMATLRTMSLSVAGMLEAGQNPYIEAAAVKDVGTTFEQSIPELAHALLDVEPTLDTGSDLQQVLGYITQVAPSFSLRGGTREVLRGILARGLGLR